MIQVWESCIQEIWWHHVTCQAKTSLYSGWWKAMTQNSGAKETSRFIISVPFSMNSVLSISSGPNPHPCYSLFILWHTRTYIPTIYCSNYVTVMSLNDTVDGRNPAAPGICKTLKNNGIKNQPQLLRGFLPSTVFVDIGCHNLFLVWGSSLQPMETSEWKYVCLLLTLTSCPANLSKRSWSLRYLSVWKKHESNNQYEN